MRDSHKRIDVPLASLSLYTLTPTGNTLYRDAAIENTPHRETTGRPSDGHHNTPRDDAGDEALWEEDPMNRRTKSGPVEGPQPNVGEQQGDASTMSFTREHRRKFSGVDGNAASQAAHLMSREGFTLDDDPPALPGNKDGSAAGFWELPVKDRRNFMLLVMLYFLQGIPMGLAGGSVPFLLKQHLSYSQIGIFSLASYPYSLKLLWSPIVDAVWSPRVGRRKSWILPVQMLSGFGMIYLGSRAESMMAAAGADGGAGVWNFTWFWFFLVFTCATQDIAVDGGPLAESSIASQQR